MCGGRWKLKIPSKNNLFFSVFCVHLFIYRVAYKFERTVLPRPFFSFSVLDQPASFRFVLFCIFFVSFIMFRCQGFDAATGRCTVKVKSCKVNICELCTCVCVSACVQHLRDCFVGERLWLCSNMFMLLVIFLWISFCAVSNSMNAHSCKQIDIVCLEMASCRAQSVCMIANFCMHVWVGFPNSEKVIMLGSFFLVSHYHEQHFTFGFGFGFGAFMSKFISFLFRLTTYHTWIRQPHICLYRHLNVIPYSNVYEHIELCVRETQTAYAIY